MRIKKCNIENFRSILNSGEILLDPKITVLIGRNESGKTNILKALEFFEGEHEYTKDDLCLHSELRRIIDSGETTKKRRAITGVWYQVEREDRPKLLDIHPKLSKINEIKCTRFFDNSYLVESQGVALDGLKTTKAREIIRSFTAITELANSLKKTLDGHAKRHPPFSDSEVQYNKIINGILEFRPHLDENVVPVFTGFYNSLLSLPNADERIQNDVKQFKQEVQPHTNKIKETLSREEGGESVLDEVLAILPQFVYFADIEKLEDTVPIEDFLANPDEHKTMSNLIKLCGLDLSHVKDAGDYEMLSELRSASTVVSGLVNESWKQERVDLSIRIVRDKVVVSLYDNIIGKEHPPSIRSQGFQWFLSFYINFTAGSQGELSNTIILLDDPGVYLHASGQKDLLNTLEKISQSNQIILSTHSPFMIDRFKLDRIRIVSKKEPTGTLIEEKFYKSDFDALHPVRASIGMTLGDTLFTVKKNLLVEGYSDELILEAMSRFCNKQGKEYVDTSKVSVLPANGADKMPYFATLLAKENLSYVVLLDDDPEGRRIAKQLKEKFNIPEESILTLGALTHAGRDAGIEDLIDFDFYLEALNLVYKAVFKEKLGKETLTKGELQEDSMKGINRFFRHNRIGTSGRLDKIKVAKSICQLLADQKIPTPGTISNFSGLFKLINQRMAPSCDA